jgi:hypothetical protein
MKARRNQSGVALVITLIMLSVITIIAVAFLALSQRERASLSQTLAGTEAELMASTGLERSKSHIMAEVSAFLSTNTQVAGGRASWRKPPGMDLTVSKAFLTNYTSYENWTNMDNADYQALTNLFYDPQVPVFTTNNSGQYELVDYLDLNRNGRFDPTGLVQVRDDAGNLVPNATNFVVGDPQWIGVLARPNEPHSSSNRFIGRYAYIVLPAGRTLDIDFIHNHAKIATQPTEDGFYRNQGHGTWELNLAAFLADLNSNTDFWGNQYLYDTDAVDFSRGNGFLDANFILQHRYRGRYNQLLGVNAMFGGNPAARDYEDDGIDQYVDGHIPAGPEDNDKNLDRSWPGASNPQRFFSVHDVFNIPVIQPFSDRLRDAGTRLDTYNRHTFYRMLAQLGTDSEPEKARVRRAEKDGSGLRAGDFLDNARINLNYENTNDTVAADFIPWGPTNFFNVAADRLLREYGFQFSGQALSVTNLPVYPTNHYSGAVHRVLQMAINIFDATTNFTAAGARPYPSYPTVLKPVFRSRTRNGSNEVYIARYRQVGEERAAVIDANNWIDLSDPADRAKVPSGGEFDGYAYGVPLLVGAKKGYPNFNEYAFQTEMQVHRKLEMHKPLGERYPTHTNHAFFIGISNFLGMELWNSYKDPYPRPLTFFAAAEVTRGLRNDEGFSKVENTEVLSPLRSIPAGTWLGGEFRYADAGLILPPPTNHCWFNDIFQPLAIYNRSRGMITDLTTTTWEPIFPAPQWELSMTNRVRMMLFDGDYIVDAVSLAPPGFRTNVTRALAEDRRFGPLWRTNRTGGFRVATAGISNQVLASLPGAIAGWEPGWENYQLYPTTADAKTKFRDWLFGTNHATTVAQVPFTPHVKIFRKFEWRANDPLVHYMDEDLRRGSTNLQFVGLRPEDKRMLTDFNLGAVNPEYNPWGGQQNRSMVDDGRQAMSQNLTITDPKIKRSDDWDFPTNKFPTLGWLGRVHRGTPWQTVYFKAAPAPGQDKWLDPRVHYSLRAHPTNDWILPDIFTVAQHPNASRGRLSINQTNLAAWSAVLSGAEVPTFVGAGQLVTNIIQPVLREPHVETIVKAINARREALPGRVYNNLREFIGLPELTTASPYLNPPYTPGPPGVDTLSDRDYEAIPEKILSLVHVGEPRFVVYAFGQSLKPAPQSILTGGNYRGLVTNYEVTGELATRAVMRVELSPRNPPGPPVPRVIVESFNFMPPD